MVLCSTCKSHKSASEFHKNRTRKTGLQSSCKNCKKTLGNAYRVTNEGKESKRRRSGKYCRTEKGKATQRRGDAKQKDHNPERIKARWAVHHAVRNGKLPRPDTFICSCKKRKAQEYHHHKGYAKQRWLDVVPKCTDCHTKLHKDCNGS